MSPSFLAMESIMQKMGFTVSLIILPSGPLSIYILFPENSTFKSQTCGGDVHEFDYSKGLSFILQNHFSSSEFKPP